MHLPESLSPETRHSQAQTSITRGSTAAGFLLSALVSAEGDLLFPISLLLAVIALGIKTIELLAGYRDSHQKISLALVTIHWLVTLTYLIAVIGSGN